jgi:8-oxo-dGTP pyrophosphatase MutT (NUDIX family)
VTPFDTLRERLTAAVPKPHRTDVLETSVAALLTPGKSGLEVLLIRRAVRKGDPWSGQMGLPGGRREPGDADLLDTAVRETREELGVDLPRASLLGALDDVQPSVPSPVPLIIRPFVFGLDPRPDAATSAEVAASYWVPLETLLAVRGTSVVKIRGTEAPMPCFAVPDLPDGLVVWGLTYRILDRLLPLLG